MQSNVLPTFGPRVATFSFTPVLRQRVGRTAHWHLDCGFTERHVGSIADSNQRKSGIPNMRRYLLAGIVAGLMVVVSPSTGQSNPDVENAERSSFAVQQLISPSTGLRDEAEMVLVGGGLFVLAALLRRAT